MHGCSLLCMAVHPTVRPSCCLLLGHRTARGFLDRFDCALCLGPEHPGRWDRLVLAGPRLLLPCEHPFPFAQNHLMCPSSLGTGCDRHECDPDSQRHHVPPRVAGAVLGLHHGSQQVLGLDCAYARAQAQTVFWRAGFSNTTQYTPHRRTIATHHAHHASAPHLTATHHKTTLHHTT